MAKFVPGAPFRLDPATEAEIKKQRDTLPKIRQIAEIMKGMGEDTEDVETLTDAVDQVSKLLLDKFGSTAPVKKST